MGGPIEQLEQIKQALGDLPERLAAILGRQGQTRERDALGRFASKGGGGEEEGGGLSGIPATVRRFAKAGRGLVPGAAAIDDAFRMWEKLQGLLGAIQGQGRPPLPKGATVAPPGSVPPVRTPPAGPAPPALSPAPNPPAAPTPPAASAPSGFPKGWNVPAQSWTGRPQGTSRGPAPPDWSSSPEAGEWHTLKNALDRGAEFNDNLQRRFEDLDRKQKQWASGQGPAPSPGAGPTPPAASGPSGGGKDESAAALRDAAQQLADAARQLADAARQLAQAPQGGGQGGGGKGSFGQEGEAAEGAGEEVGGLEEVEIAAAFV